jgi:sec-independent protein translocase protein TatA
MLVFGITELLIILVILIFLYGGKRLSQIGQDLGRSITEFKKAKRGDPAPSAKEQNKLTAPKEED